jgi:hypothetical protein
MEDQAQSAAPEPFQGLVANGRRIDLFERVGDKRRWLVIRSRGIGE